MQTMGSYTIDLIRNVVKIYEVWPYILNENCIESEFFGGGLT